MSSISACGRFYLLQVVGNPYVSVLGAPETASSRLNLAQGINSMGTTLAPLFGAYLILGDFDSAKEHAASVQGPYIGLALFAILVAIVFSFSKLPTVKSETKEKVKGNVMKFRQVRLGVIALTLYVGAEVTIGSFIVPFLGESSIAGFNEQTAAKYIPLYWGGLMVGRLLGAAILQKVSAQKVLVWAASAALILLSTTLLTTGHVAMWAMILTGLFNSIMWSNIFAMAIDGLGKYTIKASGVLVMAPVGGAIIPFFQGVLADIPAVGLHASYFLPLLSFLFILYYGINGYKPGKNEETLFV